MPRIVKKSILLSFVGTNDAGKLRGAEDGAILTVFRERKFDEVHLLWNRSSKRELHFDEIAHHVMEEILNRKYCRKVYLHEFDCNDVTDHNEIYPKLLSFCRTLLPSKITTFTAAIASGTPAMQVCWILMAESGDFPLTLIRSNEPKFGKPYVRDVRLGTGLPRITQLKQENENLQKKNEQLLPQVTLVVSTGTLAVGDTKISLSPVEFSYYRYFALRVKEGKEFERVSGISLPSHFLSSIIQFHKESFPESDTFRRPLEEMLKKGLDLDVGTFRGNISKLNKKIRMATDNAVISDLLEISAEGSRHSRFYGVRIPSGKISIKK
jgi:hypothetical protein